MSAFPRLVLPAMCLLLVHGVAHGADEEPSDDNAPPPLEAAAVDAITPVDSATSQASVTHGPATATVSVLNPHLGGSPLWLWLERRGRGNGEFRFRDARDRIVWRAPIASIPDEGRLVILPRPAFGQTVRLEVSEANGRSSREDLNLNHPRLAQLSLPVLLVGGEQTAALAERMRARAPDRLIHVMSPQLMPVAPAAYLGVSAVVLGPDVVLPDGQGRALRLFSCARGGVVSLGPVRLPPHARCQDPPVLVGDGRPIDAGMLVNGLRQFQVQLGILEERGPMTMFGAVVDDVEAAGALLSGRPPVQLGLIIMLLILVAMGVAIYFSRATRPVRAFVALCCVPLLGAFTMVGAARLWGGAPEAVRLVTVDARGGAPVALVRAVEASTTPRLNATTDTAWLVTIEPQAEDGKKAPSPITQVWDVLDVPAVLSAAPDSADPSQVVMRSSSSTAPQPAYNCGSSTKRADTPGNKLVDAHGTLLLERCAAARGVVAPLEPSWIVAAGPLLDGVAPDGRSAWVYLVPGQGAMQ